jgi:hypothetical protein
MLVLQWPGTFVARTRGTTALTAKRAGFSRVVRAACSRGAHALKGAQMNRHRLRAIEVGCAFAIVLGLIGRADAQPATCLQGNSGHITFINDPPRPMVMLYSLTHCPLPQCATAPVPTVNVQGAYSLPPFLLPRVYRNFGCRKDTYRSNPPDKSRTTFIFGDRSTTVVGRLLFAQPQPTLPLGTDMPLTLRITDNNQPIPYDIQGFYTCTTTATTMFCRSTPSLCGDGQFIPPEQCEPSLNLPCPGTKVCQNCQCVSCGNCIFESGSPLYEQCEPSVPGAQCNLPEVCQNCQCVIPQVCGDGQVTGTEQCESSADCAPLLLCKNCQCVPPNPNCCQLPGSCGYQTKSVCSRAGGMLMLKKRCNTSSGMCQ